MSVIRHASEEFLHILSRPSLIQSPASLDFSATVELANRGDDLLEWSLTATGRHSMRGARNAGAKDALRKILEMA